MRLDFLILCLGRTGSTHLQALLDSHPRVRCLDELFSNSLYAAESHYAHAGEPSPRGYVARATAEVSEPVVGFKLPLNSVKAFPESLELLHDAELKVIRLSRRNLLAQYVSQQLKGQTGVSHSVQGDYGEPRIRLKPAAALRHLQNAAFQERLLDELARHNPVFRLDYEQLVAQERLDELQGFLEVEPVELRSWFQKLRTRPLPEVVTNWDEVAEALRGTAYERHADPAAA